MMGCDIAVIGAGPAGMAAAVRAQESGARVAVLDDNPTAGGQIWRGGERTQTGALARRWLEKFKSVDQFAITNCSVVSAEVDPLKLLLETSDRTEIVRPQKIVLATGAREMFLPFPGWTLPGVMGVGGLQAIAKSGLPIEGKKIVVAGSGPLLLAVAAHLKRHGAQVKLIAEQASRGALAGFALQLLRSPGKLFQAGGLQLSLMGIPYLQDCWVTEAHGDGQLKSVTLRGASKTWTEECDYAAVAYGLYPNTELAALLGCKMFGAVVAVNELQRTSISNVYCAGESSGIGGVDLALVEGEIAGYAAAGQEPAARKLFGARKRAQAFANALNSAFALRSELRTLPRPETFVCRCEDVTFKRLQSVSSFRAAKLHTRCGMGPCQGKVCGPAADFLVGWRTESIRPPVFPARLGTLTFDETEQQDIAK
ncbi:MAG TPA: FAD/NAD(P)-binding oxidoreductase [Bryobacteraceae bacterium]|nr:FAD/NAD(P)-binding oxidoreductase [Bryobacteraceae bacterium]